MLASRRSAVEAHETAWKRALRGESGLLGRSVVGLDLRRVLRARLGADLVGFLDALLDILFPYTTALPIRPGASASGTGRADARTGRSPKKAGRASARSSMRSMQRARR